MAIAVGVAGSRSMSPYLTVLWPRNGIRPLKVEPHPPSLKNVSLHEEPGDG